MSAEICPACGSRFPSSGAVELAKSVEVDSPVCFRECESCGCLHAEHAASLAAQLYASRDSTNFAPRKLALLRLMKRYKLRHDYLPLIARNSIDRLIDYGCGNGDLANALTGSVESVVAMDVPADRPSGLGPEVEYRSVWAPPKPFGIGRNLFILRHVLEHFENPVHELEKLAEQANSGDLFVVETPNSKSIFRRIMGAGWPGFFPPFHVTVPNAEALKAIAARAGLDVVSENSREPAIVGTWFTQKYRSSANLFRLIGLSAYPIQWTISKLTRRSEAIELTLCKP